MAEISNQTDPGKWAQVALCMPKKDLEKVQHGENDQYSIAQVSIDSLNAPQDKRECTEKASVYCALTLFKWFRIYKIAGHQKNDLKFLKRNCKLSLMQSSQRDGRCKGMGQPLTQSWGSFIKKNYDLGAVEVRSNPAHEDNTKC
uniref:Uncharacterized protein n=1 Tax=Romanomermis culicivorax TaxID=13658 RepID=A0A915J244_ROMCU